jgi:ubiquinone/menaquinone biosynthesis C-methylase UbiE
MRLADLVGAEGRVFAEDIAIPSWLNTRLKAFNFFDVEVVKGEADDPKLPADRLSVVLIVDSYHHFTNYPAMLDKILHALKPGGRLAIADYSSTEHRSQPVLTNSSVMRSILHWYAQNSSTPALRWSRVKIRS